MDVSSKEREQKDADEIIHGFGKLERIATGGQSVLFRAVCVGSQMGLSVGDKVVLKVMRVHSFDHQNTLSNIVKKLIECHAANLVRYYGCFEHREISGLFKGDDRLVIVMEDLSGPTLRQCLDNSTGGRLDADVALRVILGVSAGLEALHNIGICHLDLKPSNIIVAKDAVKLIDFEMARDCDEKTATILSWTSPQPCRFSLATHEDGPRGTYDYMAPDFLVEGFCGDERSDIFSFGVLCHEMLTGRLPYVEREVGERPEWAYLRRWKNLNVNGVDGKTLIRIVNSQLRVLRGLDRVLARLLAVQRNDRPANFTEVSHLLSDMRCQVIRNPENGTAYMMLQFVGRGRLGDVCKCQDLKTGQIVAVQCVRRCVSYVRFKAKVKVEKWKALKNSALVELQDVFALLNQEALGNERIFLVTE